MAKRFFDAMGFRPYNPVFNYYDPFIDRAFIDQSNPVHMIGGPSGYQTKPSSETLGLEELQTCNRGFYALDANGAEVLNKEPDWNLVKTNFQNGINVNKSVYFDTEYWITPELHADLGERLGCKYYTGRALQIYTDIFKQPPAGTPPPPSSVMRGIYGLPTGAMHPQNPQAATDIWKQVVAIQMNGGELSKYIMQNINCLFPSFYPYDYGAGNLTVSINVQIQFNSILLTTTKANNIYNYPIYGFFTPRLIKPNGTRPFLNYASTYTLANWILQNCDGIVLWDWDGYGGGLQPYGTEVVSWDSNAPWFKAIKDLQAIYNRAPVYQTINAQNPNQGISFR